MSGSTGTFPKTCFLVFGLLVIGSGGCLTGAAAGLRGFSRRIVASSPIRARLLMRSPSVQLHWPIVEIPEHHHCQMHTLGALILEAQPQRSRRAERCRAESAPPAFLWNP